MLFGKKIVKRVIESNGTKDKKVSIFSTGQSFVSDSTGQDIEIAGKNWFLVYLEWLDSIGIDPLECEFILESGVKPMVKKIEIEENGVIKKKIIYSI